MSAEDLRGMIARHELLPEDRVRSRGGSEWLPARTIDGLFDWVTRARARARSAIPLGNALTAPSCDASPARVRTVRADDAAGDASQASLEQPLVKPAPTSDSSSIPEAAPTKESGRSRRSHGTPDAATDLIARMVREHSRDQRAAQTVARRPSLLQRLRTQDWSGVQRNRGIFAALLIAATATITLASRGWADSLDAVNPLESTPAFDDWKEWAVAPPEAEAPG